MSYVIEQWCVANLYIIIVTYYKFKFFFSPQYFVPGGIKYLGWL